MQQGIVMVKRIYLQTGITIFIVFILLIFWEFFIGIYIPGISTRSSTEHWYSVFTTIGFVIIAIIFPAVSLTRANVKHRNIQRNLRNSEERYKAFVNKNHEGIFRFELQHPMPISLSVEDQIDWFLAESVIAECNNVYARMYGFRSSEEVTGKKPADMWGDDHATTRRLLERWITSGYKLDMFEAVEQTREGIYKWFLNSGVCIIENQAVVRIWGSQIDITVRKQADQILRESEEKFRQLADNIDDVFWIVSEDWQELFYISPAYEKIWGRTCTSLMQAPLSWLDAVHPEDKTRIRELIKQPKPDLKDRLVFPEYRIQRPDGEIRWIFARAYPIRDQTGQTHRFAGIAEDITDKKEAERALRESEERYRNVVDNANEAIIVVQDNTIKFFNKATIDKLGFSAKNMSGSSFLQFIHPDDREIVLERHKKRLKGEKAENIYTIRIITKTGKTRWMVLRPIRIHWEGRAATLTFLSDVTEEKRIEDAIREIESGIYFKFGDKMLQTMIVHLARAVAADLTFVGELTDDNTSIQTLAVCSSEGIADNFLYKLEGTPCDNVFTKNVCTYADNVRQLFPEDRVIREAGIVAYVGVPLFNSQKQPLGLLVAMFKSPLRNTRFVESILALLAARTAAEMERYNAEKKLLQLKKAVDTSSEAIFMTDREGTFTFINPEFSRLYGYTAEEVIGTKTPGILKSGTFDKKFYKEFWQTLLAKNIFKGEFLNRTKSGDLVDIESSANPILDDHGEILGFLAIQRDISERKQAENEIKKFNEELEQRVYERTKELQVVNAELKAFSYSVSHDLRAPLRSLNGFSQALLEDYHDSIDATGVQYLERIRAASTRMAQLIEDMLNLAQVTRSKMQPVSVDLSALAETIIQELRESHPERQVTTKVRPDMKIQADKGLMQIALYNLLGNSWKFTEKQTSARIEFGITTSKSQTAFFVRDNGVGFDMTYSDKLFQPFQRLHNSDEFKGTGIGLSTVQRIINRHHGDIWFESEEGKGTAFYFTIGELIPGK
jgi:PAS domain S-box-containing protein